MTSHKDTTINAKEKASLLLQIDDLLSKIDMHNHAYYINNDPLISDADYDNMCLEMSILQQNYASLLNADSQASLPIGADPEHCFKKIQHLEAMLSLESKYSEEDLMNFIQRIKRFLNTDENINFAGEVKIDGLSFSAVYNNGTLKHVATRGNGNIGEDVTNNMLTIKNFPRIIESNDVPILLDVRGEVYMKRSDFEELNMQSERQFSNPRNAAAGSMRQLDSIITSRRKLSYFAYSISTGNDKCVTQIDILKKLESWGFCVSNDTCICDNIDEMLSFCNKMKEKRHLLEYDIDGLVFKLNNIAMQKRLGYIARSPRWAIAYKFSGIEGRALLRDVKFQVGRIGTITPVAELNTVNIGGVMIKRATLHNFDDIKRKDIRIGDTVVLKRAGDVIPQIIAVDKNLRKNNSITIKMPINCPSCNSMLMQCDDGVALRCNNNKKCREQIIERLRHFVSREAFDIMHLGLKQISRLHDDGLLHSYADIFKLTNAYDVMIHRNGWGKKSFANLMRAIQERRKINLHRLIYAIGIKHVGEVSAVILAQFFNNIKNMINLAKDPNLLQDLSNVDGIGEKIAREVAAYFSDEENMHDLSAILNEVDVLPHVTDTASKPFSGQSVVFTGKFNTVTRKEMKIMAERLGFKVASDVSSILNFVVYGNDAGSKLTRAKILQLQILSEELWMKKLEPYLKNSI